jgi:hypothetical protein
MPVQKVLVEGVEVMMFVPSAEEQAALDKLKKEVKTRSGGRRGNWSNKGARYTPEERERLRAIRDQKRAERMALKDAERAKKRAEREAIKAAAAEERRVARAEKATARQLLLDQRRMEERAEMQASIRAAESRASERFRLQLALAVEKLNRCSNAPKPQSTAPANAGTRARRRRASAVLP